MSGQLPVCYFHEVLRYQHARSSQQSCFESLLCCSWRVLLSVLTCSKRYRVTFSDEGYEVPLRTYSTASESSAKLNLWFSIQTLSRTLFRNGLQTKSATKSYFCVIDCLRPARLQAIELSTARICHLAGCLANWYICFQTRTIQSGSMDRRI